MAEPPSKRPRVDTVTCNFCYTEVHDTLRFHFINCSAFKETLSDFNVLSKLSKQYGSDFIDSATSCRVMIKNLATQEERDKVLAEYLSVMEEMEVMEEKQYRSHQFKMNLRSLPNCFVEDEEDMWLIGFQPRDEHARKVISEEKHSLTCRHEENTIKMRSIFLGGVSVSSQRVSPRKKVPALLKMNKPGPLSRTKPGPKRITRKTRSTSSTSRETSSVIPVSSSVIPNEEIPKQPSNVTTEPRSTVIQTSVIKAPVMTAPVITSPPSASTIVAKPQQTTINSTLQVPISPGNQVSLKIQYQVPTSEVPAPPVTNVNAPVTSANNAIVQTSTWTPPIQTSVVQTSNVLTHPIVVNSNTSTQQALPTTLDTLSNIMDRTIERHYYGSSLPGPAINGQVPPTYTVAQPTPVTNLAQQPPPSYITSIQRPTTSIQGSGQPSINPLMQQTLRQEPNLNQQAPTNYLGNLPVKQYQGPRMRQEQPPQIFQTQQQAIEMAKARRMSMDTSQPLQRPRLKITNHRASIDHGMLRQPQPSSIRPSIRPPLQAPIINFYNSSNDGQQNMQPRLTTPNYWTYTAPEQAQPQMFWAQQQQQQSQFPVENNGFRIKSVAEINQSRNNQNTPTASNPTLMGTLNGNIRNPYQRRNSTFQDTNQLPQTSFVQLRGNVSVPPSPPSTPPDIKFIIKKYHEPDKFAIIIDRTNNEGPVSFSEFRGEFLEWIKARLLDDGWIQSVQTNTANATKDQLSHLINQIREIFHGYIPEKYSFLLNHK